MIKDTLWSTVLVAALAIFLPLSAAAQFRQTLHEKKNQTGPLAPVGTEEPCISNPCLFYAGDYDDNGPGANALWNGYSPDACAFGKCGLTGTIYIPFTVPKRYKGARGKTAWKVGGLFINSLLEDAGLGIAVTSADWSIVQGVALNGLPTQVTTLCSGTGIPTVTPTGRSLSSIPEYTILLTGISCPILEAGTYWMTLLPTTNAYPYVTDVEDNTPTNVEGPGTEPVDQSFWYSPDFAGNAFELTAPTACGTDGCDKFSVGIIGTAVK